MLGADQLDLQAELTPDESRTRLTWQTDAAAQPDHFVMEKSIDGAFWTTLFAESGLGNVGGTQSYQGWDPTPAAGLNYYRVRMVDVNGNMHTSPVRQVERRLFADPLVYPNPTLGWFQIQYSEALHVRAFDQRGREVVLDSDGVESYRFRAAAEGLYTLRLEDRQGQRWHLPLVVR